MGEIKQMNLRIDIDRANEFRAFCEEQGFSQAQGFDHIMDVLALNQAKTAVSGRVVEIEEFERNAKALLSAYITSLELAENTELRVREDFQSLLASKDTHILSLQKQIEAQNTQISDLKEKCNGLKSSMDALIDKERAAFEKMLASERSAKDKEAIVQMLTSKLSEAEEKLSEYPALTEELRKTKNNFSKAEQEIKDVKTEWAIEREKLLSAAEIEKEKIYAEKDRKISEIELTAERNLMSLEKEKNAEIQQLRDIIDSLKDKLIEQGK